MKAPDKIYLPKEEIESRRPWIERPYEDDPNWDECYIRKEALLEWANSWLAFKRSGVVLDDGFSYAMEELIKKLNEM